MKKIIDLKKNDIVIPTIDELGIDGYDLINDTNAVFSYINKYAENDFDLEYIKK